MASCRSDCSLDEAFQGFLKRKRTQKPFKVLPPYFQPLHHEASPQQTQA